MPRFPHVVIELPEWIAEFLPPADHVYETVEERMQLAVDLSRLNVEHQTGGPFGAAIFDMESRKLIAPGVNRVVPTNNSSAHGEIVAVAVAQQVVKSFDLGADGLSPMELVTSTEPCAMCFGATVWSGVVQLVCGARDEDARAIGFDEGEKSSQWISALEERGISVVRDILRDEATAVLRGYNSSGGPIYNGRGGE